MARSKKGHGSGYKYSAKAIIEALDKHQGAIVKAASELGCSYITIQRRAHQQPSIREAIDKHRVKRTDLAEFKLGEALERGEAWAIRFQLRTQGRQRGYYESIKDAPLPEDDEQEQVYVNPLPSLPADCIASSFLDAYRDIRNHDHMEYVFHGGRGSTKSSFISLVLIWLLINNEDIHVLAVRQVAATLRDSVYSQIQWAIDELGLNDKFKATKNPLEITYLPTGQKVYFRGADDPNKIKSIKPRFGYIGALWFEELDQFYGQEAIRKVEQSAIRGGDMAYIFKSFNPPRAINNWANKYVKIPKETQYQHNSTYLEVPRQWLGLAFLDEAEHLKKVNPPAYEHEYLGVANGAGGMVFENIEVRTITDEEIEGFERIQHGLDFGYYPDPAHYVRVHYNPATLTLYVIGELRRYKTSNKKLYEALIESGMIDPSQTLICDSAEPKSIGDLRDYGLAARGAEKGPDSLDYSMKWLQSLAKIVVDPVRAPATGDELLAYEYEISKEGEIISDYPDKDNHGIDAIRYATNFIWRRRGQ